MSSDELLYVKGCKVWLPHGELIWQSATISETYKKNDTVIKVQLDNGNRIEVPVKKNDIPLPYLRNPAILIGQNDLTSLSYLHEPGVLHNLKVRFCERQIIYTYCGIVLVAINPYAELPLYGPSIIRAYRGRNMGEMEPHIYALAEEAYAKLEREKCNMSIIVSGESGAGKTVSTKYAMRYFAAVGGSESETQIERKVLASSPILEAFGNAKTTRNDNSSRFGKFTKLLFKNNIGVMHLTGATMQTYLLEKSRVVHQTSDERNYHIFYQLCAAHDDYPHLILDQQENFKYLNDGDSLDVKAKTSEKEQFNEILQAMQVLGCDSRQISDILNVLAAILHLGNIKFINNNKNSSEDIDSQDSCDICEDDLHLNAMGDLLRIDRNELRKWLIMRQIDSVNEMVLIPNTIDTALATRNALAKHIYAKLFQYIVMIINNSLNTDQKQSCSFIGVLDIYGFETFDTNSFEQFCINYANEKLQQQFNQHVFKLEQEEYIKEGISWTMIDFYDNQPCIDLIENKLGVLNLLDEECRMPKGTDQSWADKLVEQCSKFSHFEKSRFGNSSFYIKHFSDSVQYNVRGFLDKNRDTVYNVLVNVIRQSDISLCKQLMELDEMDAFNFDSNAKQTTINRRHTLTNTLRKRSVSSQFRESLSSLITTLHTTTPHYVRCIKPNDEKIAFKWDTAKIVLQLRACGVLETIRISAAGFPSRWTYMNFYIRYQLLCHRSQLNKNELKSSCCNIVTRWIMDSDKYRFGNTQIFFRAGQVAYLEQIRANVRKHYVTIIQSVVRGFISRRRFQRLIYTAVGIQKYARGLLARQRAQRMRVHRAAIIITKYTRGWIVRKRYKLLRRSVCGIQQYARGMLARKRFQEFMNHYHATQVQRFVRGYLARRRYHKARMRIIICQAAVRRYLARRLFLRMKAEAKTISHIEKMYKGLENKIITMQQRIDELNQENINLKQKSNEITDLKYKLEMKRSLELEFKNLKLIVNEKDGKIAKLLKDLEDEKDEKMLLLEQNTKLQEAFSNQKEEWELEKHQLQQQLQIQLEELGKQRKEIEANESKQRLQIISQVDNNEINEAYQITLKQKEALENENYNLKEELRRLSGLNGKIDYINIPYHQQQTVYKQAPSSKSSHDDDDIGYGSAKSSLDSKIKPSDTSQITANSNKTIAESALNSKDDYTLVILKLRNLLEQEKKKYSGLKEQLDKTIGRHRPTETALRLCELEVENEKLRNDYDLLRHSIRHGVEMQELEAQHKALADELRRRRDECIQLKAVLQQQNQCLKSCGYNNLINAKGEELNSIQENELMDAFQAQKLINRQLESELHALTEENNAHFAELTQQIDELRNENHQLQEVLQSNLNDSKLDVNDSQGLHQANRYLKHELKKTLLQYSQVQEEMNSFLNKFEAMKSRSDALTLKMKKHGIHEGNNISSSESNQPSDFQLEVTKQKSKTYQGLLKFRSKDLDKIFNRLVNDMTTQLANRLLPGFPAYIIFMCIRYTDLINADEDVRDLLSKFVNQINKIHRNPNATELRILWMVNSITLLNLLKQYGDVDEYIKFNTEKQIQQQLKNFNLCEYRRIIFEIIIKLYEALTVQIEALVEPFIVAALLENDELQRTSQQYGNRGSNSNASNSNSMEKLWANKQLIIQLDHVYNQFQQFGLDACYAEQIIQQLMYYICAVAMNCLMLRGDICMWETGMIIRYNLVNIENWVRESKMSNDVLKPMQPLYQVSQLLQSRKSEKDVDSICDICINLSTAQVLKVMKSYKLDDYESEITNKFLEKLTEKLNQRQMMVVNDFTMDQNFIQPFKVVFKYSDVKLEDIELPKHMNLNDLLMKI